MKLLIAFLFIVTSCLGGPNVIFIIADDLGADSCYPYGCDTNLTPNIDSIATDGMRFTAMFSSGSCAPSRAMLMTGRDSSRTGITGAVGANLPISEVTISQRVNDLGIATGLFGKWNLWSSGNEYATQDEQLSFFGWDTNYTYVGHLPQYGDYTSQATYEPYITLQEVLGFIEDNADGQFFCWYATRIPHGVPGSPSYPPTPLDPDFTGTDTEAYHNLMVYHDWCVSNVLAKVASEGIANDTIIMFTGDNGTPSNVTNSFNSSSVVGSKATDDTNALWVPFYIKWPGTISSGTTYTGVTHFVDIPVTIADLLGTDMGGGGIIDGKSFADQLTGTSTLHRRHFYTGGESDIEGSICGATRRLYESSPGTLELRDVTDLPFGDIVISTKTHLDTVLEIDLSYSYTNESIKAYGDRPWYGSTNENIFSAE